ncbi:MAG: helix-turn-helix transcriptional regulator [Firmicutes bacterium]|uniref:Helix-turn-helix transcriptional regulator n=1 Tax=Candidatus Stercoripulliclostridium pullicola TaxID=2840953 RepID=A0A940DG71_9FIRM|nr:helix-turn-helix transcriptional regulator [Candidatus Stercoripulliclostridium pullicola]
MFVIASRIKELRQEKGMSQAQLGAAIGVSQKAVDYWERGVNEPKASYIYKMAEVLEVSSDYLLGLKDW